MTNSVRGLPKWGGGPGLACGPEGLGLALPPLGAPLMPFFDVLGYDLTPGTLPRLPQSRSNTASFHKHYKDLAWGQ